MNSVPTRDVAALVNCLARATDPTRSLSLDVRRRRLLEALAQLIGANAWVWIGGPLRRTGDVFGLRTLDGGWQDDRERLRALEELGHPTFQPLLDAAIRKPGADGSGCSTEPASNDAHVPSSSTWRLTLSDFSDLLTATCPAPAASNCLIGLLRRNGAAPFLERDRRLRS
jgi:hypothetical protein